MKKATTTHMDDAESNADVIGSGEDVNDARAFAPPQAFLDACAAHDIAFDDGDLDLIRRFLAMVLEANTQFNLTRITDLYGESGVWHRHVLDSLTLLPFIVEAGARSAVDVGSGAGFPGMVLAIVLGDVNVTLLEATGKKARFLEETARALGLKNVTVVNERAETAGRDRDRFRERFDVVLARAVGPLPVLLELTVSLAVTGGHILAIKGARAAEEIAAAQAALHALHCHVVDTVRTTTGTVVVIEKQRKTPKMYPRRPGEPKRDPIR